MYKYKHLPLIISLLFIPVIIYLYFLNCKTNTAYGDDLYVFRDFFKSKNFSEQYLKLIASEKFRPVNWFVTDIILSILNKNIYFYYLLNVSIQALNTIILSFVINIILKSSYLSIFLSLLSALSRFSFYNMNQLLLGGLLEGMAITFFILSLLFIVKFCIDDDTKPTHKFRYLCLTVIFANFALYTHERYIVIFAFIIFISIFYKAKQNLSLKHKMCINALSLLSILINIIIKKYIYLQPFFVGTGGTHISFSLKTAFGFLLDALLSLIQLNSGPEYLIGIKFLSLKGVYLIIVAIILLGLILLFTLNFKNIKLQFKNENEKVVISSQMILYLFILLLLCLIPAIVTIRLEQRWLQASFIVLIIIISILFGNIKMANKRNANLYFLIFCGLFLFSDYNYFKNDCINLYMKNAEKSADIFKQAILTGQISNKIVNIFIYEHQKDINSENALKWELCDGYFFEFYQNNSKKIAFIDSLGQFTDTIQINSFKHFNKETDRVILIKDNIIDITDDYLIKINHLLIQKV